MQVAPRPVHTVQPLTVLVAPAEGSNGGLEGEVLRSSMALAQLQEQHRKDEGTALGVVGDVSAGAWLAACCWQPL